MTNNSKTALLGRLEVIFRDHFLDDSIMLTELSSPEEIEAWDSLAHVNLLFVVEAAFKVHFSAEEMGEVTNVAALMDTLQRKGAGV